MHIVKAYSGQWGVYHPLFLAPAVGKGECLTLRLSYLTIGEEKYLLSAGNRPQMVQPMA